MRVTFIFGNGFDVNLGLKTKYEHFYPTYLKSCEMLSENNCIKRFSQKIKGDNYENWSDFEWAFSQNAEGSHQEIGEIIADFNDKYAVKVVSLDDVCRNQQVNDGCFEKIDDVPKYALTLTVPTLMSAKYNFCVVPAKTKAVAVKNTVFGEISEQCPATILRNKDSAILYCDNDSSSLIR